MSIGFSIFYNAIAPPSSAQRGNPRKHHFGAGTPRRGGERRATRYTKLYPANLTAKMKATDYPFVRDAIADAQGNIHQVVIDFQDYLHLLEAFEDEGLYQAMMRVKDEVPLSLDEALAELEKE